MKLKGICASLGPEVRGRARVIVSSRDISEIQGGDIVIAQNTDMDLTIAFNKIVGIITEEGGIMQHAAILAREFNIPCLVATHKATKVIENRQWISLDVRKSEVSSL